jgi:hypothetical protein
MESPTAVMVDLGWPWWVTSVIAVVVVLLAAWAGMRSRREAVRGIAALLVVQGIAIAIAAPFVMEDRETNGSSAAMGADRGSRLSSQEFARSADANCTKLGEFSAKLGNPTTPAGIARQMDRLAPELWKAFAAQARLLPPEGRETTAQQWMTAMAAFGSDLEAVRNAAKRNDPAGMNAANERLANDSAAAGRHSRRLGMHVCFQ